MTGGNERVVRPRLADASSSSTRTARRPWPRARRSLGSVVYHNKLGTQGERAWSACAPSAKAIATNWATPLAVADADQAALLAKTDLVTDMVGEFPELQGIMGGYYALNDGLGETVAHAIEDHYKARFAGDALPQHRRCGGGPGRQARKPWSACSASATCPPATAIRLRCAAMRWA